MQRIKHGLAAILLAASATAGAQTSGDEVFRGLGGHEGIRQLVAAFLPMVAGDARLAPSFEGVDTERLARLLAEQFCELGGGPCKYSGKDMKTVHEDLGITAAQFNALAEDLQSAMTAQGIAPHIRQKVMAGLAPLQRDVVTK